MKRKRSLTTLTLGTALCAVGWTGGGSRQAGLEDRQPLVLTGATLIDGRGGPPLPNSTLVIEGDRIRSIEAGGGTYPAQARRVDLSGKFIIPGLIESHAHYEPWLAEMYLNHGVTTVMAPGEDLGQPLKRRSREASSRMPRLFDCAGRLRLRPTMSRSDVQAEVRRWLVGKPDFANPGSYNHRFRDVYRWAAEEIHQAGLVIFGHTEHAPDSIRAGQDVVEHIWGFVQAQMSARELVEFQEGRHLHWASFIRDWSGLEPMIEEAVERGVALNPTFYFELGSLSSHARRHEMEVYRAYSDPDLMSYFPQGLAGSLLQKQRKIRNFSDQYESAVFLSHLRPAHLEEFRKGYRQSLEFLRRWVRAGGRLHAGTDAPSGGTPGLSLHHELELFVEAGLTPREALLSATSWSRGMLSRPGGLWEDPRIGTLVAGNYADLVVLSANPLEEITHTRSIERVMKGGRFVELGYHPAYYTFTEPPRTIMVSTPVPEISAITPHTVVEGHPEFDLVVEGVGFVGISIIRIEGITFPTEFINSRTLRTRIPAEWVASAEPNPWMAAGPYQKLGIFGDRTLSIRVHNPPPEGGTSDSVSLRVRPRWRAE